MSSENLTDFCQITARNDAKRQRLTGELAGRSRPTAFHRADDAVLVPELPEDRIYLPSSMDKYFELAVRLMS